MKNSMQVMCAMLTSMEVAEMVEKRHDNLVRSINRYSAYIEESNNKVRQLKSELAKNETEDSALKSEVAETEVINLQEFWIKSSYADEQGKDRICYNITKKGCEFIAHKCTGKKGTVFTARYINRFHEMEREISGNNPRKRLSAKKPVPKVSNCPAPPAENWYRKNRWKIKSCVPGLFQSEYDTLKAAEMYEEQTGKKPERAVDLLDFFPDMVEYAQLFIDYVFKWRKVNGLDPDEDLKKKDE